MDIYDQWVESLGLPIHTGYHIEDLKTVKTGWWKERGCHAAFIQLGDLEGTQRTTEAKVMGIPPGETTRPWKLAVDDIFYVLEGKGLTTVWRSERGARKTFEWQKHSLFLIPRHTSYQLTNVQGDKPAKLLSNSCLPLAMVTVPDPEFFFKNPYVSSQKAMPEDFYSEAKSQLAPSTDFLRPLAGVPVNLWHGNFFPDLKAWDKFQPFRLRGGGGSVVGITFPNSPYRAHMSVFDIGIYKKAHTGRSGGHGGSGLLIVEGEGYTVCWKEFDKRIISPWHEGSCFSPYYYHQHFNLGATPARYLALRGQVLRGRLTEDPMRGQIEYPDEDPWIRQHFEAELAKRGLKSLMPKEAYKDRNYQWEYAGDTKD